MSDILVIPRGRKMVAVQRENDNQNNMEIKTEPAPSDDQQREVEGTNHAEMSHQRPFHGNNRGVWRCRLQSRRARMMQRTDALVELLYSIANNPGRWVDRLYGEIGDNDEYRGADREWGAYHTRGNDWRRGGSYRGHGSSYRGRGGEHQTRGGY